ncbi:MAG: anhydro-N-acetylmuramic acid kinase [Chloroflexi bacterium]|nr:anhydro-N-acetylmuramic acid kinase [Chloroflexota bacterium]
MIVLGMMSGTSADGIEAVLVEFTAVQEQSAPQWKLLKHSSIPFEPALRQEILACVRADTGTVDRICALNFNLGETYADAAWQTLRAAGLEAAQVDLIGNHGQTVWHIPKHSTLQIGSPAVIAERTGITTISNFRARDVAAGGHGAPMVAFFDVLFFTHPTINRACQNIGGIANVTYLPANAPHNSFAFDSGPGNMLIDDSVKRATNGALEFDADGLIAARGRVDEILLAELLMHPFLKQAPPKTTGREMFGAPYGEQMWHFAEARRVAPEAVVATMTMFTAQSIADSYRAFLPDMPAEVIVSGGGAKNPTLLKMLAAQLPAGTRVTTIDAFGIPPASKEALAFAVLAYETWRGRVSNVPAATGARHPVIQGDITPGRNWKSAH